MATFEAKTLSNTAIEMLAQLFIGGPTWDGNVISKAGRSELVHAGLATHDEGWAFLTTEGVRVAIQFGRFARHWEDKRFYRKASLA